MTRLRIRHTLRQSVDVPVLVVRANVFVQDAPPFKLPTPAGAELTSPLPHPNRARQARACSVCMRASPSS